MSSEPALALTTSRVSNKCILSEKMACQVEQWPSWDMVGQNDRQMQWLSAEEMLRFPITGPGAGLFSCGLGCPIHWGEFSSCLTSTSTMATVPYGPQVTIKLSISTAQHFGGTNKNDKCGLQTQSRLLSITGGLG